MIRYRDATPADTATMVGLARQAFTETFGHLYRPQDLATFLATHTPAGWAADLADPAIAVRVAEQVGAEQDDAAFAYAKLTPLALPFPPRGPSIELKQFYVLASWHGQGIADVLIGWVVETARARGASDLYLAVFEENHRAHRFYERHGFTRVGAHDFPVGEQIDTDLIMRRMVDA